MQPASPLSAFDPRLVPSIRIDSHLSAVPSNQLTADALRRRFSHPPLWTPEHSLETQSKGHTPVPAAVLIALVMRSEPMLLLTQRASDMSTHPGQIAFPGGRTDSTDRHAADTALREAEEEIGLAKNHIEVLGQLPVYLTGSAFMITPVVALVTPGFTLQQNPAEVAEVFEVPLDFLMNPAHHHHHTAEFEGSQRHWLSMAYTQPLADTHSSQAGERFIWGATAGMLKNLYCFLSA